MIKLELLFRSVNCYGSSIKSILPQHSCNIVQHFEFFEHSLFVYALTNTKALRDLSKLNLAIYDVLNNFI